MAETPTKTWSMGTWAARWKQAAVVHWLASQRFKKANSELFAALCEAREERDRLRAELAAALSAAEARERALVRRIIAAGDAIVERDDGEAYHQLYEALRDLGYDDLPSGTFDAARAALIEGERDG